MHAHAHTQETYSYSFFLSVSVSKESVHTFFIASISFSYLVSPLKSVWYTSFGIQWAKYWWIKKQTLTLRTTHTHTHQPNEHQTKGLRLAQLKSSHCVLSSRKYHDCEITGNPTNTPQTNVRPNHFSWQKIGLPVRVSRRLNTFSNT